MGTKGTKRPITGLDSCIYPNWDENQKDPNTRPFLRLKRPGRGESRWDEAGGDRRNLINMTHVVLISRGMFPGVGDEASHLCHSSFCVNGDHLVWEPRHVNQGRNTCGSKCIGHPGYPDCILPEHVEY